MKRIHLTLLALLLSMASFAQVAAISGPSGICTGATGTVSDVTPGGTWSSANVTIATISSSGIITGIAAGATTISYVVGASYATLPVTVYPVPAAITGSGAVCVGGTDVLMDAVAGGVWSCATPFVATVGATSGVVTGISAGGVTITYTLSTGCTATRIVTVTPGPTAYAVTGGGTFCVGGAGVYVGLSYSSTGTNYQLYNSGTPVGSPVPGTNAALSFGLVTAPGVYTVAASGASGCTSTMSGSATVAVNPLPTAYTLAGTGFICSGSAGSHIGLDGTSLGVNYRLFLGAAAVGSSVAGTGTAIDFGLFTATGTYTAVATNPITGCSNNMVGPITLTVAPLPTVYTVSGGGSYCAGGAGMRVVLDNSDAGVTYQLYNGTFAVGLPLTGTGGPLDFGLQTVAGTYGVIATNISTSCTSNMTGTATITILPVTTPTVAITAMPGTTICAGTSDTFTATGTGGGPTPAYQWRLNGVIVAGATNDTYISATLATGDVVSVLLTSSYACTIAGSVSTSVVVTIDVPTVTATATAAACGGSVTLHAGGGLAYFWSPSTGLSCGGCASPSLTPTTTATYTVTATDALGCTGTATVTTDGNRISGHITYSGAVSTDTFTVWLIQFNPSDSTITALDSTVDCLDAGTPYFEFMDKAAGDYLVKAKLNSAVPGTSGYIPTYSLSTPHWDSATSVSHTAGADVMDITMVSGTVPPGPGFISGYVVSGAGRGTAADIPAPGMTIYLKTATGRLITYTTTAADGTYSFSGLAYGSYLVYPETYKYYTTPSLITLASGSDSSVNNDFKQHTSFGTINAYVSTKTKQPVPAAASNIALYPNPATSAVNISWPAAATGAATVTITDLAGKTVSSSVININAAGNSISTASLEDGTYLISIKAGSVNYTSKITKLK